MRKHPAVRGVVHIWFAGGHAVLPANDPYDCQVALDYVRSCARRQGRARLQVNGHTLWIRRRDRTGGACAGCGRSLATLLGA